MSAEIYIGVGSNLEPEKNILHSLELLAARVKITAVSPFYRTRPAGGRKQPDYYNGVWQIDTVCTPGELKFRILRNIENVIGRQRQADKYVSRCIDLDLLLYGEQVIQQDNLQIPDPGIYTRNFIAIPLYEINPALILPGSGQAVAEVIGSMDKCDMQLLPDFTEKLRQSLHSPHPC